LTHRLLSLALLAVCAGAQTRPGTWDATLVVNNQDVAFRLELQGQGKTARGAILDGDKRIWSSSGDWTGGKLLLKWDYFDSQLQAELHGEELRGAYTRRTRAGLVKRDFRAVPFRAPAPLAEGAKVARFDGAWRFKTDASKGTTVMDGRFRQSGNQLTGTIQRVDGDFGTLTGTVVGDQVVLSHFDGIRGTHIEMKLTAAGTLEGTMGAAEKFTAARLDQAAKLGIPEPPDPSRFIAVKDPSQPLEFKFQDLDGHDVALSDARFAGKAVIVTITGSWCPNCHDEAPFLLDLYRRYKAKGLEVVSLGFEYTGEVERDRGQLRAFAKLHGITWPVLLAGTTEDGEVMRKLPQLASFGAFPTTLFVGRDHRVAAVHAGFAGPANPEEHRRLKAETEELVKSLLNNR
jgi:thiol-disulfide isomerase/thioredoxin